MRLKLSNTGSRFRALTVSALGLSPTVGQFPDAFPTRSGVSVDKPVDKFENKLHGRTTLTATISSLS